MRSPEHLFFDIIEHADSVIIENAKINGITRSGFFLQDDLKDLFIPRSAIQQSDCDLDLIKLGDEVTFEIPLWLARDRGLV